jgi:prepilin-type N-terminal cleavage/methylation domain-containing protein
MRRTRGFTLMEILIAMALTAIVTTSVLAIVRTQLVAFEMNDQVVRTQQSARAAMDFVETTVRRACGGVSAGSVGVNVAGATKQVVPCLRYYDGATVAAASFTTGATSSTDALEVVYATGTMTALSPALTDLTSSATVTVKDSTSFAVGDLVLVGDFANADLLRVLAKPSATQLTFDTVATVASTPTGLDATKIPINSPVLKAASYSFFVAPAATATYGNMLMIDPDGVASANHVDYTKVQPAVEGVIDFQVAVGVDANADGVITESAGSPSTDEWFGNAASETVAAPPWNTVSTYPQLKQVRVGLILQTLNSYPGTPAPLTALEDRPFSSYPTVAAGANAPRYRAVRMVVAPRAWNLAE